MDMKEQALNDINKEFEPIENLNLTQVGEDLAETGLPALVHILRAAATVLETDQAKEAVKDTFAALDIAKDAITPELKHVLTTYLNSIFNVVDNTTIKDAFMGLQKYDEKRFLLHHPIAAASAKREVNKATYFFNQLKDKAKAWGLARKRKAKYEYYNRMSMSEDAA